MNVRKLLTHTLLSVLGVLLCLSTSWYAWNQSKQDLRDKTLEKARIVAASIDAEQLLCMQNSINTAHEHVTDRYYVNQQLCKIQEIVSGCQFSYLLGLNEDRTVCFLADSQPQNSPTHLNSAEVYEQFVSEFTNQADCFIGSIVDDENTVMTVLIPISDNMSNKVIGALGLDIQTAGWSSLLISKTFITPCLTLSIVLLVIALHKMNRHRCFAQQQCFEKTTFSLELEETNKQLFKLSRTDLLTSLCNRFSLDISLEHEISRYERYESPFSVILIDIDFFKSINDQFGHCKGDDVLIQFSHILNKLSRSSDVIGRWGGEEFLILCPQTTVKGATLLAENLRQEIENYDFKIKRALTASFGIAGYVKNEAKEALIRKADVALYEAKNSTRNCVVASACQLSSCSDKAKTLNSA